MRRLLCNVIAFAGFVGLMLGTASAQTASPLNHLSWTQPNQDLTTAQAAIYSLYDGPSLTPISLADTTCTAGTPNPVCTALMPALTPGAHTVTITQRISGAESDKSNPASFTFVIVVTPANLTIK